MDNLSQQPFNRVKMSPFGCCAQHTFVTRKHQTVCLLQYPQTTRACRVNAYFRLVVHTAIIFGPLQQIQVSLFGSPNASPFIPFASVSPCRSQCFQMSSICCRFAYSTNPSTDIRLSRSHSINPYALPLLRNRIPLRSTLAHSFLPTLSHRGDHPIAAAKYITECCVNIRPLPSYES